MALITNPFTGLPPEDIPLENAPIVRVISQIRFPLIASIEKQDYIASFQEEMRKEFPVLKPEQGKNIIVGQEGIQLQNQTIWRFYSKDEQSVISLAVGFVALEVLAYKNQKTFVAVLEKVLTAVKKNLKPEYIERIGVRYLNQVKSEHLKNITKMVRPEVLGVVNEDFFTFTKHCVLDALFDVSPEEICIRGRWGFLNSGLTHDPIALHPLNEQSWILDIDAFLEKNIDFDVSELKSIAINLSNYDYRFFRWAVTAEFLKTYGGKI